MISFIVAVEVGNLAQTEHYQVSAFQLQHNTRLQQYQLAAFSIVNSQNCTVLVLVVRIYVNDGPGINVHHKATKWPDSCGGIHGPNAITNLQILGIKSENVSQL